MDLPISRHAENPRFRSKRLIVCCDGTWENSLAENTKPVTNVTRISRSFKQVCSDGTSQIIYYQAGLGTGGLLDAFFGGAFGRGLGMNIREAYNFICTNYVDTDDIILIGFSRGAFTARSIADLIGSIGLLNTRGMVEFYPIFKDYENMADENRSREDFLDDSYDFLTPYNGEKGKAKILWENRRKEEYKHWLKTKHWTRDTFRDGSTLIRIKAVAVWDTVGSLGIPTTPLLHITGSNKQWKFTNTQISSKVENAFQALALEEPRASFKPALWERLEENTTTYLKQVWFPGSHANVGGGWYDQQVASITLAWICDQLTTVGVEFSPRRLTRLFIDTLRWNAAHPYPYVPSPTFLLPNFIWTMILRTRVPIPWASTPIPCPPPSPTQRRETADDPPNDAEPDGSPLPPRDAPPQQLWALHGRPWALGQTRSPRGLELLAGTITRRPGCFRRVDPDTNRDTGEPLLNTNERVHSCVRTRLACAGMSMDDRGTWACAPLLRDDERPRPRPVWRLERGRATDPRELPAARAFWRDEVDVGDKMYDGGAVYHTEEGDGAWRWVWDEGAVVKDGVGQRVYPPVKVLPEEPLVGYWERHLLALTRGEEDVWRLAEARGMKGMPGPEKDV